MRPQQVLIEPIVLDRPTVAFYMSVLLGLSGLYVLNSNLVPLGPGTQSLGDVLWTLIPTQRGNEGFLRHSMS
jgi:hypothetical protein